MKEQEVKLERIIETSLQSIMVQVCEESERNRAKKQTIKSIFKEKQSYTAKIKTNRYR